MAATDGIFSIERRHFIRGKEGGWEGWSISICRTIKEVHRFVIMYLKTEVGWWEIINLNDSWERGVSNLNAVINCENERGSLREFS